MSTQDRVNLSDWEQRELALLEARACADDPVFSRALGGGRGEHAARALLFFTRHHWLGPVCAIGGMTVMIATVDVATWASIAGTVLMAAGMTISAVTMRAGREHHL